MLLEVRQRSMTKSPAKPRPVPVGRYRYSKWRWRVSVRALDAAGGLGMRLWRLVRPARSVSAPRRILVVQLDHLGDAVLTSPLLALLRASYPAAQVDVLASPSNREVFEADPHVDRVRLATRTWFERRRGSWALGTAVWTLGRSLRDGRYDLGIDVRGDILTVLVMALAGIPRRVGWAMGGGAFLLTDVAEWVPGRHEVRARLALLDALEMPTSGPARVTVHVNDGDRLQVGRLLREAWPEPPAGTRLAAQRGRLEAPARSRFTTSAIAPSPRLKAVVPAWDEPDSMHAGRFGASA